MGRKEEPWELVLLVTSKSLAIWGSLSGTRMDLTYEVYSGIAVVDFQEFAPDRLHRKTISTLLPRRVSRLGGNLYEVLVYPKKALAEDALRGISATAAVAVAAEVEEGNLFGVDNARAMLKKQPHLEDDPVLLELSVDLAVRAAVIVRISYQVALWVEGGPEIFDKTVLSGERPFGV